MSALRVKQETFTKNVAMLINFIFNSGCTCTFGDAFRSLEQAGLNAKAGIGVKNSQHCKRLAIDLNLFDKKGIFVSDKTDEYIAIGAYWESLDKANVWGGNFKRHSDSNHFEMIDL
jgi:hypothetical protein